ncbi:winged helix-turn-helix transcriptional regulator [Novosphingobium mangrovi (ex Huang et al. 2023)]|uniref:Winged helix-turn-helix transcriptional regulator n=1 Tax=Novosphingobium mangrovi (ex Huang et al. 2023) TaxID=2976432 RepID=A0ABT2I8U2_9SPHN|nr:winged helix-turn-helix transcriptional regulator [Novosphingobium mangrovi (ex Huang et al. 2023)]MCT2400962.1 winged helix-turn-helix transcriptional regulator [Novosphingobium mangrovi (ex Huang et al. 2023)]
MKFKKETRSGRAVHGKWYGDACAVAFGMELIGERWTLLVIRELMLGGRRFSDIRASLPGLSAKTLTERLETLQDLGIVERAYLPPPVSAQVYQLTEWGRGLEPALQELGRWALRSPLHDPGLLLTPVSLMLSLRTMLDPSRIGDLELWVALDVGDEHFAGRLRRGELSIHPAGDGVMSPDLRFSAPGASDFLPVFYGKRSPEEAGGRLKIEGDPALAQRFIDLFVLPPKWGS